jgi:hypothetical protein
MRPRLGLLAINSYNKLKYYIINEGYWASFYNFLIIQGLNHFLLIDDFV